MEIELTQTKKNDVKQELIAAIQKGLGLSNNKLPSERNLATQLGVSRFTIRRAIDDLIKEGLLVRNRGSGTYIRSDVSEKIIVRVAINEPEKIMTRHFLGKLGEHAYAYPQKVDIQHISGELATSRLDAHKKTIKLFTLTEPVSLFSVTFNDLPWLVEMGYCEDLTDRIGTWPCADNLYQIALDAVTHKGRIYGLPFHCTLGVLQYHKTAFERIGLDAQVMVQSLDGFLQGVEKFARVTSYKYSLFCRPLRFFLMNLLRAFYRDLSLRFSCNNQAPIERAVGLELLEIVYRLKWKLRAFIPCITEMKDNSGIRETFVDTYVQSQVPMGVTSLVPEAQTARTESGRDTNFIPFGFGMGLEEFSLFNGFAWIINPRQPRETREFVWRFLSDYVNPQTDYELDRRYLEGGIIHYHNNSFVSVPKRVPDDPSYDIIRRNLFKVSEMEIPYPSAMFEPFVLAAERILLDPQINLEQEYDFYLTLANRGLESNIYPFTTV